MHGIWALMCLQSSHIVYIHTGTISYFEHSEQSRHYFSRWGFTNKPLSESYRRENAVYSKNLVQETVVSHT